jgi:hypothetical protein
MFSAEERRVGVIEARNVTRLYQPQTHHIPSLHSCELFT